MTAFIYTEYIDNAVRYFYQFVAHTVHDGVMQTVDSFFYKMEVSIPYEIPHT